MPVLLWRASCDETEPWPVDEEGGRWLPFNRRHIHAVGGKQVSGSGVHAYPATFRRRLNPAYAAAVPPQAARNEQGLFSVSLGTGSGIPFSAIAQRPVHARVSSAMRNAQCAVCSNVVFDADAVCRARG